MNAEGGREGLAHCLGLGEMGILTQQSTPSVRRARFHLRRQERREPGLERWQVGEQLLRRHGIGVEEERRWAWLGQQPGGREQMACGLGRSFHGIGGASCW